MLKITPLDDKLIVEENERYVEIYKITCYTTKKIYIGQAVSHILNAGKYRRYGMVKRFNCHISEAYSTKKNQCHYLNNAIRKYGKDDFSVELLDRCYLDESDNLESHYIKELNSMFPSGYNLKFGTKTTYLSEEGRKRVSEGVYNYYKDKKYERFKDIKITLDDDINKYIKPLSRDKIQYGWYVYIEGKKADFGGKHISLEISKKRAEEFIYNIKRIYSETP